MYNKRARFLFSCFFLILFFVKVIPVSQVLASNNGEDDVLEQLVDDNYLILALRIGNNETDEILECYDTRYGYYISFEQFMEIVLFKINFNSETHDAKGWYISEDNKFHLNYAKKEVALNDKVIKLDHKDMVIYANEVYINTKVIERIFPVNVVVDVAKLSLSIYSPLKLPFMLQYELSRKTVSKEKTATPEIGSNYISDRYSSFSEPIIQIAIDTKVQENDNSSALESFKNNFSYRSIMSHDLLWMDSTSFIAGSKDGITQLREQVTRIDRENNLLGFVEASKINAGDVVNVAGQGVGFSITNASLRTSGLLNRVIISGDSMPGWKVELYRNKKLLKLITIDDTGRYIFEDVKLFYGNNIIEIVQYGPYGEIKRKKHVYSFADNMINDDKLLYDIQFVKPNNTLFNVDGLNSQEKWDNYIKLGKRIANNLTMYVENLSVPEEDDAKKNVNDQKISLITSMLSSQTFFEYQTQKNNDGGVYSLDINFDTGQKGSAKARIKPYYMEGVIQEKGVYFDYQDNFGQGILKGIDITMENHLFKSSKQNNQLLLESLLSLQKSIKYASILQNFNIYKQDDEVQWYVDGNTIISRKGVFNNTLNISYDIEPELSIVDITYNNGYKRELPKDIHLTLDFRASFPMESNSSFVLSSSLVKELITNINMGVLAEYDSETKDIYTGLQVDLKSNTLLFRDSSRNKLVINNEYSAESPLVSITSFIDNNGDGYYNEDDELIPGIAYIVGGGKSELGNKDGISIRGNLRHGTVQKVYPDLLSIEDPEIISKFESIKVMPRSGKILSIHVPYLRVGSIDGNLYVDGKEVAKAKMILTDIYGQKVKSYITDSDGFYFFPEVPIGNYYITFATKTMKRLNLDEGTKIPVSINTDNMFVEYWNIDAAEYIAKDSKVQSNKLVRHNKEKEKYMAQLASKNYGQEAVILRKSFIQQAPHMFEQHKLRIMIDDRNKNEPLRMLKIDKFRDRPHAARVCREIKQKLSISCNIVQEIMLKKAFLSKANAERYWQYLKNSLGKTIKSSDNYFLKKHEKYDGSIYYKMKIITHVNHEKNLRKICKFLNKIEAGCYIDTNVKLHEAFNQDDYKKEFSKIAMSLAEYQVLTKEEEYDFSGNEDKVDYKLKAGIFQTKQAAKEFCRKILLYSDQCRPVKFDKFEKEMKI